MDQPIDVRTDTLACDQKDPLVLPKLPHPQVALDPGLKVPIQNRNIPLKRALQAVLALPPCPLLERLEDHSEVVTVVVETGRRNRQHLGLEQVLEHGVERFQRQQRALVD